MDKTNCPLCLSAPEREQVGIRLDNLLIIDLGASSEVLLQAAANAGAEVRRGASVRTVRSGALLTVTVEYDRRVTELQARLVVTADGRTSLEHRRQYQVIHEIEDWLRTRILKTGTEARVHRTRARPLHATDSLTSSGLAPTRRSARQLSGASLARS